jgi:hypothetical protein
MEDGVIRLALGKLGAWIWLIGLQALMLAVTRRWQRHGPSWPGLLAIVACLVGLLPGAATGMAVSSYLAGTARIVRRGLVVGELGIDGGTGLPITASGTAGFEAEVNNGVLRVLVRTLGPPAGAGRRE